MAWYTKVANRFGALVENGLLRNLYFDETRFAELVPPTLDAVLPEAQGDLFERIDDRPLWEQVLERAGPGLCDLEWLDRAARELVDLLSSDKVSTAADREAVAAGLLFLTPDLEALDEAAQPWRTIPAEVVFQAQLRSWLEDRDTLDHYVGDLADAMRRGELDAAGLRDRLAQDRDQLEELLKSSPELEAGLQKELDESLAIAHKAVRSRRPPSILSVDEATLLLVVFLVEMLRMQEATEGLEGAAFEEVRERHMLALVERVREELEPVLLDRVATRCLERAQRARKKREQRRWAAVGRAFDIEPELLVLELLQNRRFEPLLLRPGEEEHFARLWGDVDQLLTGLPDYARYLADLGEAEAADRALRAVEHLQTL